MEKKLKILPGRPLSFLPFRSGLALKSNWVPRLLRILSPYLLWQTSCALTYQGARRPSITIAVSSGEDTDNLFAEGLLSPSFSPFLFVSFRLRFVLSRVLSLVIKSSSLLLAGSGTLKAKKGYTDLGDGRGWGGWRVITLVVFLVLIFIWQCLLLPHLATGLQVSSDVISS